MEPGRGPQARRTAVGKARRCADTRRGIPARLQQVCVPRQHLQVAGSAAALRRVRAGLYPAEPARPEGRPSAAAARSEEHTSELQSQSNLVCRLLLEKKKKKGK